MSTEKPQAVKKTLMQGQYILGDIQKIIEELNHCVAAYPDISDDISNFEKNLADMIHIVFELSATS
ncbi:hypothetical protein [Holospora curviuscula]|uniref:Uncharacterized protein n=1 Tax=Holospora curviuscula TaxID=1082868 RepID=A0A2S5R8L5_9PROT|nr:hypothetical protein [Holospora curviuscula]PPE03681.1 hypothetical protein HCUR_00911 [Holospora curviuscula]